MTPLNTALALPIATTDSSIIAGTDIISSDTGTFQQSDLTARDNGTTWLMEESYAGQSTVVTQCGGAISTCVPSWRQIDAEAIDGVADSSRTNVGSDPHSLP